MPYDAIKTIVSSLTLIGLVIGLFQLRTAMRTARANVCLRLIQEWSTPEIYSAIIYVHELRRKWKSVEPDYTKWMPLAQAWVEEHAGKSLRSDDPDEKQKADEWIKRRIASQFIAKMGFLMMSGHIRDEDFFGVVPETGRILIVLAPIEQSVRNHFIKQEEPVSEWDVPFDKLVFEELMSRYLNWFNRTGKNHVCRMSQQG